MLVEIGSERGREVLSALPHLEPATDSDRDTADQVSAEAAGRMGRAMDTEGLSDLLYAAVDHPQWEDVASRCLACGNCTMVCPTCFCTSVEDHTALTGQEASRSRVWDSCFTGDFSYLHGGSVRSLGRFAVPAVGDPQARLLGRPVRYVRLRRLRPLHHLVPGRHRHHRGGRRHPRHPHRRRAGGLTCRPCARSSPDSRSSWGSTTAALDLIAGCATNVHVRPGTYLFREGEPADTFYVVRRGRVALEVHEPAGGARLLDTVEDGEVAGLVLAGARRTAGSSTPARSTRRR